MHKKEEVNETKSISDLFKTSKSESDSKNQKGFENVFEKSSLVKPEPEVYQNFVQHLMTKLTQGKGETLYQIGISGK